MKIKIKKRLGIFKVRFDKKSNHWVISKRGYKMPLREGDFQLFLEGSPAGRLK
jgi:hypothetical protein